MKVINLTQFTQQVGVRHADGKMDGVRISPRGRIDLRSGMEVDVRWLQLNPGIVRVVEDSAPITDGLIVRIDKPVTDTKEDA